MKKMLAVIGIALALATPAIAGQNVGAESAVRQYHLTQHHHAVQTPWSVQAGSYVIVAWNDENTAGTALLRTTPRLTLVVDGGGFMNQNELQNRGVPPQLAAQLNRAQLVEMRRRRR